MRARAPGRRRSGVRRRSAGDEPGEERQQRQRSGDEQTPENLAVERAAVGRDGELGLGLEPDLVGGGADEARRQERQVVARPAERRVPVQERRLGSRAVEEAQAVGRQEELRRGERERLVVAVVHRQLELGGAGRRQVEGEPGAGVSGSACSQRASARVSR